MLTNEKKRPPEKIIINLDDLLPDAPSAREASHEKIYPDRHIYSAKITEEESVSDITIPRVKASVSGTEQKKRTKAPATDKKEKITKKGVLKNLLAAALIVLLVFGATGAVVVYRMFGIALNKDDRLISRDEEDFVTDEYDKEYADEQSFEELAPDEIELQLAEPLGDGDLLNILLVGQDRRPGEERARSDAMILCSINPETGKAAVISFLRDLYVTIPGYSDNRLNAAYAFGGFPLLKQTLKTNFGITVDGCFEADFDEFISLIDIIGGTEIEITAAEANIIGDGAAAGYCHLNGKQTLSFARIRKIGSDFGRTERQRKVIFACLEKARQLDINQLLDLVKTAMPYLSTDLTPTQITKLITKITTLLPKVSLGTYFIPGNGCYSNAMVKGMAVLLPDLNANRDLLKNEYLPF